MQIHLHADPHLPGGQALSEHLDAVMYGALGRFGERITRVEVHLSDADGTAKSGPTAIQCTLETLLIGIGPVVVREQAASTRRAIDDAARKLKRAVGAAMAQQDPRRPARPAPAVAPTGDRVAANEPGARRDVPFHRP